jgi:hypothetical protein
VCERSVSGEAVRKHSMKILGGIPSYCNGWCLQLGGGVTWQTKTIHGLAHSWLEVVLAMIGQGGAMSVGHVVQGGSPGT